MNIAIITGTSSGLGAKFLRAVAEKHTELDEIWLIARRQEKMEQLITELPYQHFRILPLDLSSEEAYREFESILHSEKPNIRILINNAVMKNPVYLSKWKNRIFRRCCRSM